MFGTFYEQWRNQAGKGYQFSLNQLLSRADSEYTHLVQRHMWKAEEESQVITLMGEVRESNHSKAQPIQDTSETSQHETSHLFHTKAQDSNSYATWQQNETLEEDCSQIQ